MQQKYAQDTVKFYTITIIFSTVYKLQSKAYLNIYCLTIIEYKPKERISQHDHVLQQ